MLNLKFSCALVTSFTLLAATVPFISSAAAQQANRLLAQSDIRTQQVQFPSGANSTTVEGAINGYEIVDYVLKAEAGETLNVSLATDNSANYFNLLAPGETEVAFFNGSTADNQYEGTLSKSGDYKIRVYMMRSAARRNEVANYRLEVIVAGAVNSASRDALVQGTNYHATGTIPCAMGGGQPTASCAFGVTRQGGGSGTVTIEKSDGRSRTIFFQNGEASGYDQSQADSGRFRAEKQNDLSIIYVGQERYEIPDVVIWGD